MGMYRSLAVHVSKGHGGGRRCEEPRTSQSATTAETCGVFSVSTKLSVGAKGEDGLLSSSVQMALILISVCVKVCRCR